MPGRVLISSNTGSGHPADEAVLAAALRLLQRGSWGETQVLTGNVARTAQAHPSVVAVPEDEIDAALTQSRLLMIVGDLVHADACQRAAHHVLLAKARAVPVALVSVRLRSSCDGGLQEDAALRILAQAESITTCDATSASIMARCSGRRVATTAPLELVHAAKPIPQAARAIALEAELLEALSASERQILLDAVAELVTTHDMRATIVCSHSVPSYDIPQEIDCVAVPTWTQWMRALSQVRLCIARPDSVALHLAVAQGAIPISPAQPARSDLTERIGLRTATAGMCQRSWKALLQQALGSSIDDVCARSAPLRVVAWRALGSLSEAVRSHALELQEDEALRRSVLHVLQTRWERRLEAGDFRQVETELDLWRCLAEEPVWALARAHAWVLQGMDDRARSVLEDALTSVPQDNDCLAMLAMILWRSGDAHAASRCWSRIIAGGGEAAHAAQAQQNALLHWTQVQGDVLPGETTITNVDRTEASTTPTRRPVG